MARVPNSVLALIACVCWHVPVSTIGAPLEAYGQLPAIEMLDLSDDGHKLAFILSSGDGRVVAVRDLKQGTTKPVADGDAKIRRLDWAGPEHLLITTSTATHIPFLRAPRDEWATTVALNVATGKVSPLLQGKVDGSAQHMNVTMGTPTVRVLDGKPVVFLQGLDFINREGRLALFRVDLTSGRQSLVESGSPLTTDWLVGLDGEAIAETRYDDKDARWTLRVRTESGWHQFPAVEAPISRPWLAGLGNEPSTVLVADPLPDTVALREIKPAAPAWGEPIRTTSYDSMLLDPLTSRLVGFHRLVGDEDRYEFLDAADASAWKAIVAAFKGQRITFVDRSVDRSQVLIHVDSPADGESYAIVDLKNRRAIPIGAVYPTLSPTDIAEVRPVRYKARDGLEISGYLTLPKDRPARPLPLVVLPHGGPESRDVPGFDWWSQALASRGYAVLRPNFRGSSGFGTAFTEAGFGEWGRKMQTDLSDGVRHLAAEGLVDAQRVCIVGASYGGYAALAGAAFDAPTYRCAVSVAGPSEMRRMLVWSKRQNGHDSVRYWSRFMGAEDAADPVLQEISPALHAAKITIPVLLIHGKDDTVVPVEQTKLMEKALQDAGKRVETLIMDGEDHWLSRGETRLAMLKRVTAFLEQHNPPM